MLIINQDFNHGTHFHVIRENNDYVQIKNVGNGKSNQNEYIIK